MFSLRVRIKAYDKGLELRLGKKALKCMILMQAWVGMNISMKTLNEGLYYNVWNTDLE